MPNLPVFRLKPVSGTGPVKILHRNHILPIGQELRQEVPHSVPKPRKRVLRRRKNVGKSQSPEQEVKDAPEMQEVKTRADSNIGSSDSEDESYGVWFPEPVDCQFTPRRTEISQKDAVVSEDVTGNVEHSDTRVETLQEIETVESIESGSRLLSENDSDNLQDVSRVSDLCDNVISSVQDLVSVHQTDADQNTSDDVPETGRRSQRTRNVPKRFTYDTFGVPKVELVLAQAKVVNPVRYCSTAYLWLNMTSRKLSNCTVTLNPRQ